MNAAAANTITPEVESRTGELMSYATKEEKAANAVTIDSPTMAELCAESLNAIVARRKEIEDERFAITRPMDAAKKRVLDLFARALDPLGRVEAIYRRKLGDYARAEQLRVARERREAQDRAEREQREREAEARQLREQEAERNREAQRLIDEAERTGKPEAIDKAAEAKDAALDAGERAVEAEARADAAAVAAPVVVAVAPRIAGVTVAKAWKAEVTDMAELIRAAVDKPELRCLLKVDQTALNAFARALKAITPVPGIRFYEDTTTRATGRSRRSR